MANDDERLIQEVLAELGRDADPKAIAEQVKRLDLGLPAEDEFIAVCSWLGSAPGRGVIPTLARTEWSLARSSGEVRAGCWAAMDVLR